MAKKILMVALLTLIATGANAVAVMGRPSCGEWTEFAAWKADWIEKLREGGLEEKTATLQNIRLKSWLLGYLSGIALVSNSDFLKGTDSESAFRWMDNYCRDNPTATVSAGGVELILVLKKKNGLK